MPVKSIQCIQSTALLLLADSHHDLKQIAHIVASTLSSFDSMEACSSLVGFLICLVFSVLFLVEKNFSWVTLFALGAGRFFTVNG